MGTEALMIGISVCVLVSYWFSHLGRQLRFPSVILLLGAGLALREGTDAYQATVAVPPDLLPLLGTIGLIRIVLILGLTLNNPHLILRIRWFEALHIKHYWAELDKLKHLTAEATFFVRTFFFLLLGYSTDLGALADARTWGVALAIVALVFGLRLPVLAVLSGGLPVRPLLWAAPRGLITVLLFYGLPAGVVPAAFPPGALILVVLLSCVSMAVGFRRDAALRPAPDSVAVDRRVEAQAAPPP